MTNWKPEVVDKNVNSLKFPSVGDEWGFTWQPCWTCERPEGGDRHELRYIGEHDGELYHELICCDCVQYIANAELPVDYEPED